MAKKITILDTTLRDGLQSGEISFSVNDKLKVAKILDDFGVSYIEGGNPGSNPKDLEFFAEIKNIELKNAKICAFGSTRRKDELAENDLNMQNLLKAETDCVVIFGKSSIKHVTDILKTTPENNLEMVADSIKYLKSLGKEVIFDAEHFYDGFKQDSAYAMKVIKVAAESGADSVCLCETNGGMLPFEIFEITSAVVNAFPNVEISAHMHNDSGCAVANTLMAVKAGAVGVQGTFIGFGERCGNADLSSIIPNIALKMGLPCDGDLHKLMDSANKIAETANIILEHNRPFVGRSAFAHKAGMHVDGVLKDPSSFEHIVPEKVGNERKFLVSEVGGKSAVLEKIKPFAPDVAKDSEELPRIVKKLKDLEHFGFQYEAADASFELLVKQMLGRHKSYFDVVFYKTSGEFPPPNDDMTASAMIKVNVGDKSEMTAASGNGPVNALDLALRKALTVFYPNLNNMYLSDYKVRVIEQSFATSAKVRVLIESRDDHHTWTTIGVSEDIIGASLQALIDSIEYKLALDEKDEGVKA